MVLITQFVLLHCIISRLSASVHAETTGLAFCLTNFTERKKSLKKKIGHGRSCTGWESNPLHIQLARDTINKVESENTNGTLHSLDGIIESPTEKCHPNQPFGCDDCAHWWTGRSGEHTITWLPHRHALHSMYALHAGHADGHVQSYSWGQLCTPPDTCTD